MTFALIQIPSLNAQTYQKITPFDASSGDMFGLSNSLCGNRLIIGSYWDDNENGHDAGAAYIYHFNENEWILEDKLIASDGTDNDYFGCSVSIYNDYAIIGAYSDDNFGIQAAGSAYLFSYNGEEWEEQEKFVASSEDRGQFFGYSVAIFDDNAVVGAYGEGPRDGYFLAGAAYIYGLRDNRWQEIQRITANDRNRQDIFGYSISICNGDIVVGAPGDDDNGDASGSAYLFSMDNGSWIQVHKLYGEGISPDDSFGRTVKVSGEYVIIGAPFASELYAGQGAAFLFKRSGLDWNQTHKILSPRLGVDSRFGSCTSIYGSSAIISSLPSDNHGTADLVSFNDENYQYFSIEPPDTTIADGYGTSLDISTQFFVIGAPNDSENGELSGSVYVYKTNFLSMPSSKPYYKHSPKLVSVYPNPFNCTTKIDYYYPFEADPIFSVYDCAGRLIKENLVKSRTNNYFSVTWAPGNRASGIYYLHIETQTSTLIEPIVFNK